MTIKKWVIGNADNPEKIKRFTIILGTGLRALWKVTIAIGMLLTLSLIGVLLVPESWIKLPKFDYLDISLVFNGMIRYRINHGFEFTQIKPILVALIPVTIMGTFIITVIFFQTAKILKTVESGNPFDERNSRRLMWIAVALILGARVWNYVQGIAAKVTIETLHIPNLFVSNTWDVPMLISGMLMLILSGVFKYGTYLQKEYDSTL
ncbi:MAG TPA: DUF2975 domain-containing protein [Bacillota bacterium]|nr:DUF2975 domain-containing protein [Bacillota bacterium]